MKVTPSPTPSDSSVLTVASTNTADRAIRRIVRRRENPEKTTESAAMVGKSPEMVWNHQFSWQGHRFTLFKRNQSKNGAWCIDFIVGGRRVKRSLDTSVAAAAQQRAIATFIKPAYEGKWDKVENKKLRNDFADIGTVTTAYKQESIGRVKADTVGGNVQALRLILRRGLRFSDDVLPQKIDALSTSVLTGKLVADFKKFYLQRAAGDEAREESAKRSVRSYLRAARSVFIRELRTAYKRAGINLPGLTEFLTEKTDRPARIVKVPPPDELVERTFKKAQQLRKVDPEAYIAFVLAVCSLRRGEIRRMEWTWISQRGGLWCVVVPQQSKSKAARMVPIPVAVVNELKRFKATQCTNGDSADSQYVLPSPLQGHGGPHAKDRAEAIFRRLDKWMRDLGWKGTKTLHELRAYHLRNVMQEFGLEVAQVLAGHSDFKTTQQHYAGLADIDPDIVKLPMFKQLAVPRSSGRNHEAQRKSRHAPIAKAATPHADGQQLANQISA